jgi:methylmalonyl-CoA/ethylmalonyl-CoA epimerase
VVNNLDFDHVTAVVTDLDVAVEALRKLLGEPPSAKVDLPGMSIRSFPLGDGEIHLTTPTGPGPVDAHHRTHGPGMHHVALRVQDLDAKLAELAARGFQTLGAPVETAPGLREVFLDPNGVGGLWIQLVERRILTDTIELDPISIRDLAAQTQRRPDYGQ